MSLSKIQVRECLFCAIYIIDITLVKNDTLLVALSQRYTNADTKM